MVIKNHLLDRNEIPGVLNENGKDLVRRIFSTSGRMAEQIDMTIQPGLWDQGDPILLRAVLENFLHTLGNSLPFETSPGSNSIKPLWMTNLPYQVNE